MSHSHLYNNEYIVLVSDDIKKLFHLMRNCENIQRDRVEMYNFKHTIPY